VKTKPEVYEGVISQTVQRLVCDFIFALATGSIDEVEKFTHGECSKYYEYQVFLPNVT